MEVKIRIAQVEHLESIFEIDKNNFSNFYSREFYLNNIREKRVLIAEVDKTIVGFIIFSVVFDESELLKIVVLEDYRNMSIGSMLIGRYIEMVNLDINRKLMLEVRESNISAIELYRKFNFKLVRVIENYYSEPLEDGLFMVRGSNEGY